MSASFSPKLPLCDLVIDDDGISQTLIFGNRQHLVKAPWAAIIRIQTYDGREREDWFPDLRIPKAMSVDDRD